MRQPSKPVNIDQLSPLIQRLPATHASSTIDMSDGSDNRSIIDSDTEVDTDTVMTPGHLTTSGSGSTGSASQASPPPPLSPFAPPPPPREIHRIPDRDLPHMSPWDQYQRNLRYIPPASSSSASPDSLSSQRSGGNGASAGSSAGYSEGSRNGPGPSMGRGHPGSSPGSAWSPAASSASGGAMASPDAHFRPGRPVAASSAHSPGSQAGSDWAAYGVNSNTYGVYPSPTYGPAVGSNESLQLPAGRLLPSATLFSNAHAQAPHGGPLGSPSGASRSGSGPHGVPPLGSPFGSPTAGAPPPLGSPYGGSGAPRGAPPPGYEDAIRGWQASWDSQNFHARSGSLPVQQSDPQYPPLKKRPASDRYDYDQSGAWKHREDRDDGRHN
ncbi:hypothetical protein TRAPUB_5628 [Trametes pubescens]|uniref:Uncharacterized protein n=1 Tax=Trametes pubescens TaxID=154538 RepID=A0A1M2V7X7_TRAPU|nr:hypothetical protein TRAPUB_5628 [Trametes pubescens]